MFKREHRDTAVVWLILDATLAYALSENELTGHLSEEFVGSLDDIYGRHSEAVSSQSTSFG